MTESICANITCKLADKGSVTIVDSFGNADNEIRSFSKLFFYLFDKCIRGESNFRKINKNRIIAFKFAGKNACGGQPAGMAPHDLDDGDRWFIIIDRGINCNFAYCRSNIFGSTSVARGMIGQNQIVVDGFRNSDDADITSDCCCVAG